MNPAVQLKHLAKHFDDRVALDGISASFKHGKLTAVLGPNGSGKSTMFRILSTMLAPTNGTASILGFDVRRQQDEVRRAIGIVFQHPGLDKMLTVRENLVYHGRMYGLSGSEIAHACGEALRRFSLQDRADERVATLSGGMKRRVELAMGMLHEPQVLLLDEPSTGLDPGARMALMKLLQTLRDEDGITCLLTTHLMEDAEQCDEVAVLCEGRLIALDTPENLTRAVGGDVITIQSPEPGDLARRIQQKFEVETEMVEGRVRLERRDGHRFVPELIEAFPQEIQQISVGKPTISDAYFDLAGRRLGDDHDS